MWSNAIISVRAGRFLLFSAWWTLAASMLIGVLLVFPKALEGDGSSVNLAISALLAIVGLIGSAASLALLIGMFIHLMRISGFGVGARIAWGAILVLGLPLGAVLYFFVVYERRGASPKT